MRNEVVNFCSLTTELKKNLIVFIYLFIDLLLVCCFFVVRRYLFILNISCTCSNLSSFPRQQRKKSVVVDTVKFPARGKVKGRRICRRML